MSEANHQAAVLEFLRRYGPIEGTKAVPKHTALRDALGKAISDGFWTPGAKLPTESELAACMPFSLGTVQRAMRGLVEQGMVERRRRRGTFVPNRRWQLDSPWHVRFLSDDGKTFLPLYTQALQRSVIKRHGPWTAPLEQTDQAVIRIDRRFDVNSEFAVYTKFFVRADRFPAFLDMPLEDFSGTNLKMLVMETVGVPFTVIKELLRQAELPRHVCEEIDVPHETIGLHIQATAYTSENVPVYYQELFVPPTERRLYIDGRVPLTPR